MILFLPVLDNHNLRNFTGLFMFDLNTYLPFSSVFRNTSEVGTAFDAGVATVFAPDLPAIVLRGNDELL